MAEARPSTADARQPTADANERRGAWLAGFVVSTFLAFPHPVGAVVVDLGFLLAWVPAACLVLGLRGLPPGRALRVGLAAGVLAHWAVLHWIYVVTVRYGHAHPLIGVVAPLGLAVYIGAHTALFAWGAAWLERGAAQAGRRAWLASPLALAALWTACDHLRSFSFTGFPWATLGYAQHANPNLVTLAAFTGVYGLSFVSALGGVAAARGLEELRAGRRRPSAPVQAGLGVSVALLAIGALLRLGLPDDPEETVRVAVLQGNIDQGVKWSQDWYERTLGIYEDLTRQAAADGAQVIVWPETAVPGVFGGRGGHAERVSRLAREVGAQLVVGAVGVETPPEGPVRLFDSAFLLDADGELRGRYDKSHLVPFGEYVPFQDLLGRFFRAVARGIAESRVTAGPGPSPLLLEPEGTGPLRSGIVICYELLFPDLVRRFVVDGAEILFAITNDAWYGRTGAPYQFLAITALRSAENRVWTARAANTGVSAIIDAEGRVRERTPIFERGLLVADVPLRPAPAGGTFYSRFGDVFAWACWIAAGGCIFAARRRGAGA